MLSSSFHKLIEIIPLHWERILIGWDCVPQHFNTMKCLFWRLKQWRKQFYFSPVSTWLASWGLAADIETFVHWINKYTVKITNTKNISSRKKQNMQDLDLLFYRGKTILIVSNNNICFCYTTFISVITISIYMVLAV